MTTFGLDKILEQIQQTERSMRVARSRMVVNLDWYEQLGHPALERVIRDIEGGSIGKVAKELELSRIESFRSLGAAEEFRRLAELSDPGRQFAEAMKASAESQFAALNRVLRDTLSITNPLGDVIAQIAATAELSIDAGWFERVQAIDLDQDFELDEEGEESLFLLPNDLREGIIEVRAIPIVVAALLNNNPQQALLELSPGQMEELIAEILVSRLGGKEVYLTRRSRKGDHGLDIVGTFILGGVRTIIGYQVKRNAPHRKIEGEHVRALVGALSIGPHRASHGVICTTSGFRRQANVYIAQQANLAGWGPEQIVEKLQSGGRAF